MEKISVLTVQGEIQVWSLLVVFEGSHCRLQMSNIGGDVWEGSAANLFKAFRILREEPEAQGTRFLVAGARLNCWPTRMSSQAGGVKVAAHYRSATLMVMQNIIGYVFPRYIYRYIFSPAPASKVGTVAEQDAYQEEWTGRRL